MARTVKKVRHRRTRDNRRRVRTRNRERVRTHHKGRRTRTLRKDGNPNVRQGGGSVRAAQPSGDPIKDFLRHFSTTIREIQLLVPKAYECGLLVYGHIVEELSLWDEIVAGALNFIAYAQSFLKGLRGTWALKKAIGGVVGAVLPGGKYLGRYLTGKVVSRTKNVGIVNRMRTMFKKNTFNFVGKFKAEWEDHALQLILLQSVSKGAAETIFDITRDSDDKFANWFADVSQMNAPDFQQMAISIFRDSGGQPPELTPIREVAPPVQLGRGGGPPAQVGRGGGEPEPLAPLRQVGGSAQAQTPRRSLPFRQSISSSLRRSAAGTTGTAEAATREAADRVTADTIIADTECLKSLFIGIEMANHIYTLNYLEMCISVAMYSDDMAISEKLIDMVSAKFCQTVSSIYRLGKHTDNLKPPTQKASNKFKLITTPITTQDGLIEQMQLSQNILIQPNMYCPPLLSRASYFMVPLVSYEELEKLTSLEPPTVPQKGGPSASMSDIAAQSQLKAAARHMVHGDLEKFDVFTGVDYPLKAMIVQKLRDDSPPGGDTRVATECNLVEDATIKFKYFEKPIVTPNDLELAGSYFPYLGQAALETKKAKKGTFHTLFERFSRSEEPKTVDSSGIQTHLKNSIINGLVVFYSQLYQDEFNSDTPHKAHTEIPFLGLGDNQVDPNDPQDQEPDDGTDHIYSYVVDRRYLSFYYHDRSTPQLSRILLAQCDKDAVYLHTGGNFWLHPICSAVSFGIQSFLFSQAAHNERFDNAGFDHTLLPVLDGGYLTRCEVLAYYLDVEDLQRGKDFLKEDLFYINFDWKTRTGHTGLPEYTSPAEVLIHLHLNRWVKRTQYSIDLCDLYKGTGPEYDALIHLMELGVTMSALHSVYKKQLVKKYNTSGTTIDILPAPSDQSSTFIAQLGGYGYAECHGQIKISGKPDTSVKFTGATLLGILANTLSETEPNRDTIERALSLIHPGSFMALVKTQNRNIFGEITLLTDILGIRSAGVGWRGGAGYSYVNYTTATGNLGKATTHGINGPIDMGDSVEFFNLYKDVLQEIEEAFSYIYFSDESAESLYITCADKPDVNVNCTAIRDIGLFIQEEHDNKRLANAIESTTRAIDADTGTKPSTVADTIAGATKRVPNGPINCFPFNINTLTEKESRVQVTKDGSGGLNVKFLSPIDPRMYGLDVGGDTLTIQVREVRDVSVPEPDVSVPKPEAAAESREPYSMRLLQIIAKCALIKKACMYIIQITDQQNRREISEGVEWYSVGRYPWDDRLFPTSGNTHINRMIEEMNAEMREMHGNPRLDQSKLIKYKKIDGNMVACSILEDVDTFSQTLKTDYARKLSEKQIQYMKRYMTDSVKKNNTVIIEDSGSNYRGTIITGTSTKTDSGLLPTGTFTDVAVTETTGNGYNATLDITIVNGSITGVAFNNTGAGYVGGDTLVPNSNIITGGNGLVLKVGDFGQRPEIIVAFDKARARTVYPVTPVGRINRLQTMIQRTMMDLEGELPEDLRQVLDRCSIPIGLLKNPDASEILEGDDTTLLWVYECLQGMDKCITACKQMVYNTPGDRHLMKVYRVCREEMSDRCQICHSLFGCDITYYRPGSNSGPRQLKLDYIREHRNLDSLLKLESQTVDLSGESQELSELKQWALLKGKQKLLEIGLYQEGDTEETRIIFMRADSHIDLVTNKIRRGSPTLKTVFVCYWMGIKGGVQNYRGKKNKAFKEVILSCTDDRHNVELILLLQEFLSGKEVGSLLSLKQLSNGDDLQAERRKEAQEAQEEQDGPEPEPELY